MRKIKKNTSKTAIKISACYMVKNEEKNLPRSLDSLKSQVDEIIVVDTGSTDKTISIAESYGAKVIQTPWQDDFSTPRNLAIDNATGDWIIFLDADEYFINTNKVRSAIKKLSSNEVIMVPLINIDVSNNNRNMGNIWSLRIFKNVKYLRYRGLIHENIANISGGELNYVFANDDLTVYHTGYSTNIIKSKHLRNLSVIEKEIELIGHKPQHDIALADCYAGLEDYEKSMQCARRALDSEYEPVAGRGNLYHRILIAMRELKYPDADMLPVADEAIRELPELPEFYAERGMILCGLDILDEAYISLHKSLEVWRKMNSNVHQESYFAAAVDKVYARLAEIEAYVGNFAQARLNILEAIKLSPQNEEYKKLYEGWKEK